MKYLQNLHTHGILCDGKDSYEDTVKEAIGKGFDTIGFSGHSYMSYSPSHSMSVPGTEEYKREIHRLKEKYRGIIHVLCGIEFDMYSEDPLTGYDYIIGTVHYLKIGEEYVGFDRSAAEVKRVIDTWFHGDGMAYAKAYYETLARLPEYCKPDIIGHFDLITKHSEKENFFDRESKEYRKYALDALHSLAEACPVFEVNTGAIARGYRMTPYPDPFLLKELKEMGCNVVIGSDCHDRRCLDRGFDEALSLIYECGFRQVLVRKEHGFEVCPIAGRNGERL